MFSWPLLYYEPDPRLAEWLLERGEGCLKSIPFPLSASIKGVRPKCLMSELAEDLVVTTLPRAWIDGGGTDGRVPVAEVVTRGLVIVPNATEREGLDSSLVKLEVVFERGCWASFIVYE